MRGILAPAAVLVATFTGQAVLAQPSEPVQDPLGLRAGAWDRSVQLEREGEVEQARDLLLRAWGPTPEGYEVTVRLAWLSLQLGDAERAIAWYQRARMLPGAGPEATRGLASAHTQRGYARLEAQERQGAREDFRAALVLDPARREARQGLQVVGPASRVDPELWLGLVDQSVPRSNWTGGAVFVLLPWQVDDTWRLRFAYRYVGAQLQLKGEQPPMPGRPGIPSGSGSRMTHHNELYAGMRYRSRWIDFEPIGFMVLPDEEDSVPGAGFQLRVGSRVGALIEGASMHRESGWNHQAVPGLYLWPADWVGLAAGVRYTSEAVGEDVSGWVGLSLVAERTAFHTRGHLGTERWSFSASQPSILTITPETTAGGEATLLLPLGSTWQLGLQGDFERIRLNDERGIYFGAGLGLRWSPSLQKGAHP